MSTNLQVRALYGDNFNVKSEVGHWLFMCRYNRALRSWIRPGSYAWFRIGDDLKEWQSRLADFRHRRAANSPANCESKND